MSVQGVAQDRIFWMGFCLAPGTLEQTHVDLPGLLAKVRWPRLEMFCLRRKGVGGRGFLGSNRKNQRAVKHDALVESDSSRVSA